MARRLAGVGPRDRARTSFARGLRWRHPAVLLLALLAVALVIIALDAWVAGGGFTVVSQARLLRITHDDQIHLAYEMAALRRHSPGGPVVYYFGGSGAMDAVESAATLQRALRRASGVPDLQVVNLASHQQTFAQTLALADGLPDGDAVLLVGLAPYRFGASPDEDAGMVNGRPLLLRSHRLARFLHRARGTRAWPLTVLPGAFDFATSYVRVRLATGDGLLTPLRYAPHYHGDEPPADEALKRSTAPAHVRRNVERYRQNAAYNLAALEELLRLARERGMTVVLFEQPLNTDVAGDTWGGMLPEVRRRVRTLAQRYGADYVDANPHAGLRNDDFFDLYHLLVPGRRKWEPVFADQVGSVLRRRWPSRAAATPGP